MCDILAADIECSHVSACDCLLRWGWGLGADVGKVMLWAMLGEFTCDQGDFK